MMLNRRKQREQRAQKASACSSFVTFVAYCLLNTGFAAASRAFHGRKFLAACVRMKKTAAGAQTVRWQLATKGDWGCPQGNPGLLWYACSGPQAPAWIGRREKRLQQFLSGRYCFRVQYSRFRSR